MGDSLSAAADLFKAIPIQIRRVVYGLLGLVVLLDGALDLLPDRIGDALTVVFGLFASLMALANTAPTDEP